MQITPLQIFILANVFFIGILAAIAFRHAYAYFKPQQPPVTDEPDKPKPIVNKPDRLPPAIREKILLISQAKFQAVLNRSAAELQRELNSTTGKLNKKLDKLGTEIVNTEMKRYHDKLDELRRQTEKGISGAQTEIAKHQADINAKLDQQQTEMEAKLKAEIDERKKQLISQIDTKLSDAVASFLTDTLQNNIDLGAQTAYLTSMLEKHKAEIKKEISDEI